jgi:proton-translocating NAD(P)+ transhydrogenase subunit alpha
MKIAVAKEIDPSEPRVAASPDTVKKFKALGAEIAVEPGAGIKSGLPDSEFIAAGATVSADALKDADISAARSSSPSWTPTATKPR